MNIDYVVTEDKFYLAMRYPKMKIINVLKQGEIINNFTL